jgi:hypothetical protein
VKATQRGLYTLGDGGSRSVAAVDFQPPCLPRRPGRLDELAVDFVGAERMAPLIVLVRADLDDDTLGIR